MSWTREELDKFEAERSRLLETVRALETILHDAGRLRQPGRNGSAPAASRTGLRQAIRDILSKHPSGLRPNEVAVELAEIGFRSEGSTPLGSRVSAEMGRMRRKSKQLEKMRGGRYRLTEHVAEPVSEK